MEKNCLLFTLVFTLLFPSFLRAESLDYRKKIQSLNSTVSSFVNSTAGKEFLKKVKSVKPSENETLKEKLKYYYSTDFLQKTAEMFDKTLSSMQNSYEFKKQVEKLRKEEQSKEKTYLLFIFISSSMKGKVKDYLREGDILIEKQKEKWGNIKIAPYAILRGFLKDKNGKESFRTTYTFIKKQADKGLTPVLINPILFERYGITEVPTLLLIPYKDYVQNSCSFGYQGAGYSVFGFLDEVLEKTNLSNLKKIIREIER